MWKCKRKRQRERKKEREREGGKRERGEREREGEREARKTKGGLGRFHTTSLKIIYIKKSILIWLLSLKNITNIFQFL